MRMHGAPVSRSVKRTKTDVVLQIAARRNTYSKRNGRGLLYKAKRKI